MRKLTPKEMRKVVSELRRGAKEYSEEEIDQIVDEAVSAVRSEKSLKEKKLGPKLRALVDINLFISGLFGWDSLSAKLQDLWINQDFELATSIEV